MRIRFGWLWEIYFCLYLFYGSGLLISFFIQTSSINIYYRVLTAFDVVFLIPYLMNLLSVIMNFLAIFPLYSFIHHTPFFSLQFCRWLFATRIILDVFGRSYEYKIIKALAHSNLEVALTLLGLILLIIFPSYWAIIQYTFRVKPKVSI